MPPRSKKKKATKKVKKKTKKRRKKVARLKLTGQDEVIAMDQEIAIWTSYGRLQSILLVSQELDITVHRVRTTLSYDKERLDRIKQDKIEMAAARWEIKRDQSLDLMARTLKMYLGELLAIEHAIKEKRTLTTIRGEDGLELPVLNARELLLKARMMDQLIKLGAQAQATASALRAGHVPTVAEDHGESQLPDPAKMNDLQLVQMLKAVGEDVPEGLQLKADQIEAEHKAAASHITNS